MWNDQFEIIIVDEDVRLAHAVASHLETVNFRPQVIQNLQDVTLQPRVETCDFLLIGLQGQGAVNLKQLRHLTRSLNGTRAVAMISEELESYEELLHQSGLASVISRRMSPKQIAQFLQSLAEIRLLEDQNYRLRQMLDGRTVFGNLIGGSPPMRALYRLLDQIARTDAPVLVTGEDGTEQIEVTKAIHMKSERAAQSIVVIDCQQGGQDGSGEFLFGPLGNGHNSDGPSPKGSAFARAGKGVLVLHHIENLGAEAQRRLLDFMHHPFFQNETPGSPLPLARMMATSGTNLLAKVEAGEFLRELFYRLNILQVRVPPLRERREDIPMLAQHYLRQLDRGTPTRVAVSLNFSSRAILHLFQYDWPGNLEELNQIVAQVAANAEGPQIEVADLPPAIRQAGEVPLELDRAEHGNVPLKDAKRIFESEYFKDLLQRTGGNMTMASRFSHVGRPYLYKKIREYGLMPEEFR